MKRVIKFLKFSWIPSGLKRFSFHCISSACFLSIFSCGSQPKTVLLIDNEDREVVDDFLRYVAISELGVYTILGSKPISEFYIPRLQPLAERKALYESMPEDFRKRVSFEKFYAKERVEKLNELCKKWQKIQHKYIGDHFIVQVQDGVSTGYIVNVPHAVYVLRKHYQEFSQVLGEDFDPLAFSREIGNQSSQSWQTFIKNSSAFHWGLLFGFGKKNSKLFQWEQEQGFSFSFREASYNLPSLKQKLLPRDNQIDNLGIPQFVVYQPVDKVVENFLLERKRIIQIYQGKDFAETTVAFLKGEGVGQFSARRKTVTVKNESSGTFSVENN